MGKKITSQKLNHFFVFLDILKIDCCNCITKFTKIEFSDCQISKTICLKSRLCVDKVGTFIQAWNPMSVITSIHSWPKLALRERKKIKCAQKQLWNLAAHWVLPSLMLFFTSLSIQQVFPRYFELIGIFLMKKGISQLTCLPFLDLGLVILTSSLSKKIQKF